MTTEIIIEKGGPKKAHEAFLGKTMDQLKIALYLSQYKEDAAKLGPFFRSAYLATLEEPVAFLASQPDEMLLNNEIFRRVGPGAVELLNKILLELEPMEFPDIKQKNS